LGLGRIGMGCSRTEAPKLKSRLSVQYNELTDILTIEGKGPRDIISDLWNRVQRGERALEKLAASEEWRKAYMRGKHEMYAMGGEIQEAAMRYLPCNEGPFNDAPASAWFVESVIDGKFEGWWTAPPKDQSGWLTTDPLKAKRYTKPEAEAVAAALNYFPKPLRWSNWIATEHLFMDGVEQSSPSSDTEPHARPYTPEELAREFHDTYERLAPSFGYETRKESAKPWNEVPEQNRRLMTAVCREIIDRKLETASSGAMRKARDEGGGAVYTDDKPIVE